MISKFVILINILLVFRVLAVPSSSSLLEARLARRRENRQSTPASLTDASNGATSSTKYSKNWAGAVLTESKGTFTNVTGIFTVPTPTGSDGSASAWVGIDGDTCSNAILQTGVDFTISGGVVSYDSWFEWYPAYANDFDKSKFIISAGNEIRLTVIASSTTSGMAIIENLSTGLVVIQDITSSHSLCQQDAEWIVEDFTEDNSYVPFANFGTVTFTSATAFGTGGSSYTTDGATIFNINQTNVLTSVSASGDTLTVTHI